MTTRYFFENGKLAYGTDLAHKDVYLSINPFNNIVMTIHIDNLECKFHIMSIGGNPRRIIIVGQGTFDLVCVGIRYKDEVEETINKYIDEINERNETSLKILLTIGHLIRDDMVKLTIIANFIGERLDRKLLLPTKR